MQNNYKIAKILLPIALNNEYSYLIPDSTIINIGDIVLVNFVNRNIYGLVTDLENATKKPKFKLKTIILKDSDIKIDNKLIELINFASNYNLAPKGLFLKLAISILNSSQDKKNTKITYRINQDAVKNIKITTKRQKIIDIFTKQDEIEQNEIIKLSEISRSTLNSLVKNKLLIKNNIEIIKKIELKQEFDINDFKLAKLSDHQKECADFINNKVIQGKYNPILVDGVTGSGKTEIYFDVIANILKEESGQILILLPEIILAEQILKRFNDKFGFKANIWHSKIDNNLKRSIFYGINKGDIRVLIGTRSALFLPFKDLKLTIIDEEHEDSFKQEDIVNYHGRDMAIMRSKIEESAIVLSSATPSIETFFNAYNDKYHHLQLKSRFFHNNKAKISLIDMKKQKLNKNSHICDDLKNEIDLALKNNSQILLFLNRRGYAPVTLCKSCGVKVSCSNCSSYMTYHHKIDKLICHHCGFTSNDTKNCKSCEAKDSLVNLGAGVEKIAQEIEATFPQQKIALMTSDTLNNTAKSTQVIKEIIENKVKIIIGTQIIAKGHHFPNLALVGIIDGDSSFNNANLRASEKSFQLLTQVIGRAGREKHQAKIILQSYSSNNLIFQYIMNQERDKFFDLELQNRKIADMPPFSKMIAIIFISKDENLAINSAKHILRQFPIQDNIELFGPAPMPISKIRNKYYYRIIAKSDKKLNLQKLVNNIIKYTKLHNNVRVRIDVDPL